MVDLSPNDDNKVSVGRCYSARVRLNGVLA